MFNLMIDRVCRFDSLEKEFKNLNDAKQYAEIFMKDNPYDGDQVFVYENKTFVGKVTRYPNAKFQTWIPYHIGMIYNCM